MERRPSELEQFSAVVISRLGFHVHQHTVGQVEQLMRRCLRRNGCPSVSAYVERFQNEQFAEEELREIALELTVAETYFFRHPEQFRALVDVALPERMKARQPVRALSLLSAGCATGEEAYSLRAAVDEVAGLDGWDIRLLGIDVNAQLLEKARAGVYSAWSLRALSEAERRRHFRKSGTSFFLDHRLLAGVSFEARNLLDDDSRFWRPDVFDVIFCRNVMIYLSPAAVRALVDRLTTSLAPGGFLFLGPSETLRGITHDFHLRHSHDAFYYQRRSAGDTVLNGSAVAGCAGKPPASGGEGMPSGTVLDRVAAIEAASSRIAGPASRPTRTGAPKERKAKPDRLVPMDGPELEDLRDLVKQERFGDALKLLRSAAPRDTTDPDFLLLEAVARAHGGDLAGAEAACQLLLTRDELRPGAHYLLAFCQEQRGDYLSAAEHDTVAIYLDPTFAMPHLHLGLLARHLGDLTTARRELSEALPLLSSEDASRILLFGGGFSRESLIRFCDAQLDLCGDGR